MDKIALLKDVISSLRKSGKITDDECATLLKMLHRLSHAVKTKDVKAVRHTVNMIAKFINELMA